MNVESVEKLLEETQEAREYQKEIDQMLVNNLTIEDEEAVQTELQVLQREAVEAQAASDVDWRVELPSPPTAEPVHNIPSAEEQAPTSEKGRVPVAA